MKLDTKQHEWNMTTPMNSLNRDGEVWCRHGVRYLTSTHNELVKWTDCKQCTTNKQPDKFEASDWKELWNKIKYQINDVVLNVSDGYLDLEKRNWGGDEEESVFRLEELINSELEKVRQETIGADRKVIEWLLSDDTGASSEAICRFMLDFPADGHGYQPPCDSYDRGRCIRLLNKIPEWWNRLDEMASLPSNKVTFFTKNGMEIRDEGWKEQIELIKQEALSINKKEQ